MGLSEKFKEKLENNDIFIRKIQKPEEDLLESKNIKFISKPAEIQTKRTIANTIEPCADLLTNSEKKTFNKAIETSQETSIDKLEDLETKLISKIRKIPYWEEYSIQRQEKMITSYINKKLQTENNLNISDKDEFIQNILALANNR